jgi:hypothetical protein
MDVWLSVTTSLNLWLTQLDFNDFGLHQIPVKLVTWLNVGTWTTETSQWDWYFKHL